ncbi:MULTISPECIES: mandelate racemase/muconate lactonizing enzyme family protein [unclassified Exiguobacterium]|uniref:mandelate racemase/muconate lactonizing enzyme family protein n=1 Tax=unclassified Exiguobacterium TaxID=2644629 RepID=UPI00103C680A|nr:MULTISPECIES: dipeptide epimerase [unclassified Exiguobacterium]TCI35620.1 dipeptide epimerase [Exiguobacterium sp. SH4S7]TCI43584.1 dipeptide epimerase [Exiguobacterium sp. SH5S32]TCI52530.1 dipeptide epimerase [Exiguobacterium sp. SH1S4]TCI65302.1 dipeptide epimerase [Exiguobacterium sp. SH0S2]TCI68839.1 dipeptide epimerase [Exiguobacterium sp. SH1S1]
MKLEKIELFAIELPLKVPFIVSYHRYDVMPSVIVKMTTECGLVGYGEAVADEHVTGESLESTISVIRHLLGPLLIGRNPMHLERIHDEMDRAIRDVPAAKAALDIACHDLIGKKLGQPIYELLGGRYHDAFPVTHVLSIGEPEAMAAEASEQVAEGYTAVKMKVGVDVASDVRRVAAVRQAVGPDVPIRVDVNQGWVNAAKTLQAMRKLEPFDIDWVEQPVKADDFEGMLEVKGKISVPLMIDEGVRGVADMRRLTMMQAAHKVNVKLMKCGGIYPAKKLVHMAEMSGIECQIGSMVESSIASSAGFHVAFSSKIVQSVELTGPLRFATDVGNLTYDLPFIRLNDRPGLGVDVDEDVLRRLTTDYYEVGGADHVAR